MNGWLMEGLAPFVLCLYKLMTIMSHCREINWSVSKVVCTEYITPEILKNQPHHDLWTAQVPLTGVCDLVTLSATLPSPSLPAVMEHQTGWLEQQTFIFSQVWRREVRDQGAQLGSGESFVPGVQVATVSPSHVASWQREGEPALRSPFLQEH